MDFEKDIHKKMQHITMSDSERDAMDDAVLLFMDENPIKESAAIRNAAPKASVTEQLSQASQSMVTLFMRRLSYAALAVVLTLSIGGGTVLASQKALPGDALYGVKVNVAEEIQSRFSSSEKARAEWEAERVRRRLIEINTLLEQDGVVDNDALQQVKGHITDHSQAVALATNKLGAAGDTDGILDIVLQLQDTLDTYKTLITSIVGEAGTNANPEVLALLDNVEQTEQAAQAVQLGSFFENTEKPVQDIKVDTVIPTTNLVQLTSPKAGDILEQGTLFPITWDVDVEGGKFMTIQLLDEDNDIVGYVGANAFNVSSRRWNPQFIFDISGKPISSSLRPGTYRMVFTVETHSNERYQFTTERFSIIEPRQRVRTIPVPTFKEPERAIQEDTRVLEIAIPELEDIDVPLVDSLSEKKKPYVTLKQYVEKDSHVRPGSNGIVASWLSYTTGPAQIARLKIRCTKPASIGTTFKYMDLEDIHGNKLAGSEGVFATSPTEQIAVFNDLTVPIRQGKQTDFRVRAYAISNLAAHSVSCGIVTRNDVFFRDLSDNSIFHNNINEGQNSVTYIGENIAITPDEGEFLTFLKPGIFEEVVAGRRYTLTWDVLDASTNEYAAAFTLVNGAGTEVGSIGSVSDLSEQALSWQVPVGTQPGTHVIQVKTVEHDMRLKSDAFQIVLE